VGHNYGKFLPKKITTWPAHNKNHTGPFTIKRLTIFAPYQYSPHGFCKQKTLSIFSHPSAAAKKKTHRCFLLLFLPALVADPKKKSPPGTMVVGGVDSVVIL
jgi:hypothetical protein